MSITSFFKFRNMSHRCVYHNPPRNVTTLSRPRHMTQAKFHLFKVLIIPICLITLCVTYGILEFCTHEYCHDYQNIPCQKWFTNLSTHHDHLILIHFRLITSPYLRLPDERRSHRMAENHKLRKAGWVDMFDSGCYFSGVFF